VENQAGISRISKNPKPRTYAMSSFETTRRCIFFGFAYPIKT